MEFSNQYLSYNEYRLLGGTLDQMPFNLLEFEARKKVDERTQGKIKAIKDINKIPQEVKICVYVLINSLVTYGANIVEQNSKNIISESTDGYSISYINASQIQEVVKSKSAELNDVITTYLTGVIVNNQHVLYLGIK